MKILIIDNYDSFTYNLVHLINNFSVEIIVKKNDEVTIDEVLQINPRKIVISPGPGTPDDSGISQEIILKLGNRFPILGVCLGHQAIANCFGAKIINAPILFHGKSSLIVHDGKTIFKDVEQKFPAGRYHSLIVDDNSISNQLEISARTEDGIIMGIRHKEFPLEGIQFHPESIMTIAGKKLIENWLALK